MAKKGRPGGNPGLDQYQFRPKNPEVGTMTKKVSIKVSEAQKAKYDQIPDIAEKFRLWLDSLEVPQT